MTALLRALPACALALALGAAPAAAEGPPTPPPTEAPAPQPTAAPTPPPAAPDATASPVPSASPSPTADPEAARRARAAVAATSLLELLEGQVRRAEAERTLLEGQRVAARADRDRIEAELAALRAREADRRARLAALLPQLYRESQRTPLEILLTTRSVIEAVKHADTLAALGEREHALAAELRAAIADQERAERELAERERDLARLSASIAAKERMLEQLVPRARALAAAAGGGGATEAQVRVVRELVAEVQKAHEEADRLVASVASRAGVDLPGAGTWTWPAKGVVSQEFGPSDLDLEPPAVFGGISYEHFHDAIDIAAPLYEPVYAAAKGRVAFVGHLSDGAMVVIVAHADGIVTLYAHLDDVAFPPAVRAGQVVEAGERIGAIGLTGITTGPHLHFVVKRGGEPVDPRRLLPAR